ncbi:XdhC/CoxI family protein [bacterium]|nr:XdhC/CoxI family protein [bacterium]MBU1984407.1 XdhC/CoxI family protein [bacterium]
MSTADFYRTVVEAIEGGRAAYTAILTSTTGSTPQKAGAKMLIYADGTTFGTIGGGDVERKLVEDVLSKRPRDPWVVRYELDPETSGPDDLKMMCGGSATFLVEPLTVPHQLYVVGGGHCGVELSRLAAQVGFSVTVFDNRAEWASRGKHPCAARVVCAPYEEVDAHIESSAETYIVIMTHGHEHDELVLRRCLKKEYKYLGVIGSRRKAAGLFERLKGDGIASDLLSRVRCPIGLPIQSHTPAEIAVSIVAELIAVKNGPPHEAEARS